MLAFNLTRVAASTTGPDLAKATTPTIQRTLITLSARMRPRPEHSGFTCLAWASETAWTSLFTWTCHPPPQTARS